MEIQNQITIKKEKSKMVEEDFVPEKGFYQPSGDDGDESWEAYLALLTLLDGQLKGLPRNHVLCGVADEVLAVMKSNDQILMTSNIKKKLEIEKLIGQVPASFFNQLLMISDKIKDFNKHHYKFVSNLENEQNADNAVDDPEFYQPKNEDTWYAYNMLIAEIVQHVDDKVAAHKVVLGVVADGILSALSNKENSNWIKKTIIEGNLGSISWATFDQLVFISKLIHDYHPIPELKTIEPAYTHRLSLPSTSGTSAMELKKEEPTYTYRLSLPSTSGTTSTSVDDNDKHVDLKPIVFVRPKPKLELLKEEEVEYEYIGEDNDDQEERIVEYADCHQVKHEEVVAKELPNIKSTLKRSGPKLSFLDEQEEIERTVKDAGCHHVREEVDAPKEQFKVASPKRSAEDCLSREDPESCQEKKRLKVMSLRQYRLKQYYGD